MVHVCVTLSFLWHLIKHVCSISRFYLGKGLSQQLKWKTPWNGCWTAMFAAGSSRTKAGTVSQGISLAAIRCATFVWCN